MLSPCCFWRNCFSLENTSMAVTLRVPTDLVPATVLLVVPLTVLVPRMDMVPTAFLLAVPATVLLVVPALMAAQSDLGRMLRSLRRGVKGSGRRTWRPVLLPSGAVMAVLFGALVVPALSGGRVGALFPALDDHLVVVMQPLQIGLQRPLALAQLAAGDLRLFNLRQQFVVFAAGGCQGIAALDRLFKQAL